MDQQRNLQGSRTAGQAGSAPRDMPQIVRQTEQLGQAFGHCLDVLNRIEHAAVRITGPRPVDATRAGEERTQVSLDTIEGRLNNLMRMSEELHARLSNAANHLDAAV